MVIPLVLKVEPGGNQVRERVVIVMRRQSYISEELKGKWSPEREVKERGRGHSMVV
jgi:hypothetical protein